MAMLIFNQPYKGRRAMAVPAAKAREIQQALDHPADDISAEQEEFLMAIKKIYHNNYRPGKEAPVDTSHLTHDGIEQGMTQALPTGDR